MITQIFTRLHRLGFYGGNIRVISFLICVIIFLASGCSRDSGSNVVSEDVPEVEQKIISFNLSNYAEDGSKKWELRGDSANVLSEIIYQPLRWRQLLLLH